MPPAIQTAADSLRTTWPHQYFLKGHETVQGWVQADALALTLACHRIQRAADVQGGICEIGVHHGRFFIALASLCNDKEPSIAIDVFEDQHLNPDGSGHGDREIFEKNLKRWRLGNRCIVEKADSLTIKPADILDKSREGIRLFSVDGAHALQYALSDAQLAAGTLCRMGVILLDDFMHPDWPGVTEAALMLVQDDGLSPLAHCGGKLFLVRREDHARWLDLLEHRVVPVAAEANIHTLGGQKYYRLTFPRGETVFDLVGRELSFCRFSGNPDWGRSSWTLRNGWGEQEEWGRWSLGETSTLSVKLEKKFRPSWLMLQLGTFVHGPRQDQVLQINLENNLIHNSILTTEEIGVYFIELPALPKGQSVLDFSLTVSETRSPKALGLNADERPLGTKWISAALLTA